MTASLLDHPLICQRYFFPRQDAAAPAFFVEAADGSRLRCARFDPPGARARYVVHFHGNGEVVRDWADVFPPVMAAAGFGLLLAEYRGYGGSEGEPALVAMLEDVRRVFEALEVPAEDVVVFGRSLGGLYAVELASRIGAAGLILESAVADVYERVALRVRPETELGATDADLREAAAEHFDHAAKLADYAGRVLLLHAQRDEHVGMHHAEMHAKWAKAAAEVTLQRYPLGDHNSIFAYNQPTYVEHVQEFLRHV